MTVRTATFLALRVIGLTIVLFVCYAVAGTVVRLPGDTQSSGSGAAGALLAVCFLDVIVVTYVILRSRWGGWRLAATVFVVFYGVTTVMSQIETAVFITGLPKGTVPRLFAMGALIAAPFSVLAVLILGKRKPDAAQVAESSRLEMPAAEWAWKLACIAVVYVVLYFTFGYLVAWQNPAVREYYAGAVGSSGGQLGSVPRSTSLLVALQIVRGLLWAALALPVIRMFKGEWMETALAIGLLFAVVMNAQLLLPNPYMPESVRMAHLIETASSNFIFGVFVGSLLTSA